MDQVEIKRWEFHGDGLVIFPEPSQVIKAYKLLQNAGIDGRVVTPHPKLRLGCCALGLEISLAQQDDIERLFVARDVDYGRIIPKQN